MTLNGSELPPPSQKRSVLSVDEAASRLGLERKSVYDTVRTGAIPSVRTGWRILIPIGYFDRLEAAQ